MFVFTPVTRRLRMGRSWGKRAGLAVGLCYGLLLAISFVVRSEPRSAVRVDPLEHSTDVSAIDRGRATSARVRMAYHELAPDSRGDVPTMVLLHGSPGRKEDFERLAPILARRFRVLVPDLPGFGASTHGLPDYSFRAHAVYASELLDDLRVRRAHILGFSMGGGVALSLVDLAPARVQSLTLLSAIGVQEMELTGDYYLNHLVHGAQLAALWVAREGTPHMGALDGAMLGVPYARNFFDSDQRPLRDALRRVNVPTLIVHGTEDSLVPIEAAREHHRLVPQSDLVMFAGDHFLLHTKPEAVGDAVEAFVGRVEEGRAPMRASANPERIRLATLPADQLELPKVRGIAAVVSSGVLTAAALLSQSAAGAAAGMFVARGRLSLTSALSGCVVGVLIANVFAFMTSPHGWQRAAFRIAGSVVRMVSWIGAAAPASWVLLRIPLLAFMNPYVRAAVMIALVIGVLKLSLAAATEKGRRLMVSSLRRSMRWEFWPTWVFYPPVLAYVGYLMARHRSATLFTAANPAILAGGFVGESKYDILQGLAGTGEYVASACLIEGGLSAEDKVRAARCFMSDRQLEFPIVLKPNQGQRGSGVVVVRSAGVLEDCLRRSSVDTIVQEYASGVEFGVFYYRRPSESHGHIFSITEKRFPRVVGDGRRTLEQLILHDERAVCAARLYCDRHRENLSSVPAEGEEVPLVELGTHCRGAMFLDGGWVLTPALEQRFDAIARGFEGFNFGRFDVRVPGGIEAFRAGRGFKIIELNGVTSEATHIYQPGTPLTRAYRVLMTQWRIAFEIGAENRSLGVRTTSMGTLLRLANDYARSSRFHLREQAQPQPPAAARVRIEAGA